MKAIDLLKQLENDPEFLRRKKEREDALKKREEEIKVVETPFIVDLKQNGFDKIETSSDILRLKKIDEKLVALLLKWIPNMSNDYNSQEMLVRGLAIAKNPFDGKVLIDLFDSRESSFSLKWAIGNTIASAKVENVVDWLDKKVTALYLGKEHEMLIYAIIKYFKYEKASVILRKLFSTFPLQVADAFRMIGKKSDLQFLEGEAVKYDGVGKTAINNSIKRLIKKLEKKQE